MSRVGGRAVIIGAGMAGLAAAGALVGRFDDVIVLERDRLPERPEWRLGAPQGQHVHALLTAGQRAPGHRGGPAGQRGACPGGAGSPWDDEDRSRVSH